MRQTPPPPGSTSKFAAERNKAKRLTSCSSPSFPLTEREKSLSCPRRPDQLTDLDARFATRPSTSRGRYAGSWPRRRRELSTTNSLTLSVHAQALVGSLASSGTCHARASPRQTPVLAQQRRQLICCHPPPGAVGTHAAVARSRLGATNHCCVFPPPPASVAQSKATRYGCTSRCCWCRCKPRQNGKQGSSRPAPPAAQRPASVPGHGRVPSAQCWLKLPCISCSPRFSFYPTSHLPPHPPPFLSSPSPPFLSFHPLIPSVIPSRPDPRRL